MNFVVANISARPLWLKTVRVASDYLFTGASMRFVYRGKYATPCVPWNPW